MIVQALEPAYNLPPRGSAAPGEGGRPRIRQGRNFHAAGPRRLCRQCKDAQLSRAETQCGSLAILIDLRSSRRITAFGEPGASEERQRKTRPEYWQGGLNPAATPLESPAHPDLAIGDLATIVANALDKKGIIPSLESDPTRFVACFGRTHRGAFVSKPSARRSHRPRHPPAHPLPRCLLLLPK